MFHCLSRGIAAPLPAVIHAGLVLWAGRGSEGAGAGPSSARLGPARALRCRGVWGPCGTPALAARSVCVLPAPCTDALLAPAHTAAAPLVPCSKVSVASRKCVLCYSNTCGLLQEDGELDDEGGDEPDSDEEWEEQRRAQMTLALYTLLLQALIPLGVHPLLSRQLLRSMHTCKRPCARALPGGAHLGSSSALLCSRWPG